MRPEEKKQNVLLGGTVTSISVYPPRILLIVSASEFLAIRSDSIRSDPIRQTSACISDIVFRPASDWNWFLLWYATLARRFGSFLFGMIPHRPKWYPILTLFVWSIQQKLKKKKLAQNLRVNRRPDRAWVTVSATRADVSQEETSKQHKGLCESARTILIAVRSEWLLVESPYRLPRDALE